MHLTRKDFKRYTFFILLFVWLIIFSHLFYIYIWKVGEDKPVKWWVLIEWFVKNSTTNRVNPMPYLGNNYYSKYIQSLLFRWCLDSFWNDDLCSVKTNDNKTFLVYLSGTNYWSDWRQITLDDIFFTYNDVIYKNSLQLTNPIVNNIQSIEKKDNTYIKVVFSEASVNNKIFFKKYILPKHKLDWKNKDYFASLLSNLVNSTCVWVDLKSDYINNVILDYSKCNDYYISKYQFTLLDNEKQLSELLSGQNKVDLYDSYENIDKSIFSWYKIVLNKRYALFWNTKTVKDAKLKAFFSNKIIEWLKNNLEIKQKIDFNGYGLFVLPSVVMDKQWLVDYLSKDIVNKKKQDFENSFVKVDNKINYNQWKHQKFYIKNKLDKNLLINWTLLSWDYDKIWISANSRAEYFPKSYKWKTFKYIISEKFRNIKEWKNIYSVYAYSGDNKSKLDDIIIYYKKLDYPEFKADYHDLRIVYINKWLTKFIWDRIWDLLSKIYPWKVIYSALDKDKYIDILTKWDYDLVISNVNFDWKDISPIFKSNDSLSNPSNFTNPSFASLINQNLLAPKNLKDKIFSELNKIYQENIPVVFIWNEKFSLFIRKKYNPKNLDYSYFDNRRKFIKSVVINKIKQPTLSKISLKWFIGFLKDNLNNWWR